MSMGGLPRAALPITALVTLSIVQRAVVIQCAYLTGQNISACFTVPHAWSLQGNRFPITKTETRLPGASRDEVSQMALEILWRRGALFFLEARVVAGDTLRALKLVKSYSVPFVGRVCDQFCLCKFVECDQPLLTFGCAIVC